jgi:hypothetical protein
MKKTIKKVEKTNQIHPAVGYVFRLTFEDGTQEWVYEECFWSLVPHYKSPSQLVGKTINTRDLMLFDLPKIVQYWD